MKLILNIFFCFILAQVALAQEVENIVAKQEDDKIIVNYNLIGDKDEYYDVELYYTRDKGQFWYGPIKKATGDIGTEQTLGDQKQIIWDYKKEGVELKNEVQFKITSTVILKTPLVKLVDYSISSKNSILLKRIPFTVDVIIQNVGEGEASDVTSQLILPKNTFCLSGNNFENIGDLKPGESKVLSFNVAVNNIYRQTTIPLVIDLEEKHNKYSIDRTLSLSLNQPLN